MIVLSKSWENGIGYYRIIDTRDSDASANPYFHYCWRSQNELQQRKR